MLLVHTTCATKKEAERIATALVRAKLAACASVFPCKSFFYWKGSLERQKEFAVELKIKEGNYEKAERKIRQLHSYSVPQIIAIKAKASKDYARWVQGNQR